MTILAAVDSRRTSVSLLRLLRISICPKSAAGALGVGEVCAKDKAGKTDKPKPASSKRWLKGFSGSANGA